MTMLVYRQHHLCGAETAMSILCAGLLGVPTGSAEVLPRVDMVATATRDWRVGEVLGLDRDLCASLVPALTLSGGGPVPFYMLAGRRLVADVPEGTVITLDMIEPPEDLALWALRRQQDEHFAKGVGQ